MEDIINKIIVNKKEKDFTFDRIEMELNLKIECEKTKQLELIKDIRKIEKSIKEKELYCKRKKTLYMDNSDDTESESDSDSDLDLDTDTESETEHAKSNIIINKNYDKVDTISLCSIDSDYDIEREIDIL